MAYRYNPFTGEFDRIDTTTVPSNFANQFVTDSGTAIPVNYILNIVGDATQGILSSGLGNTVTFTIDDASTTQKGVVELATDAETIAGADNSRAITAESLKAKLGTQTSNSIPYGNGDSNAIQWMSPGTNGQVIIGGTGVNPIFANLTSTGGTISFTLGTNSLNLEASAVIATTYAADTGTATPAANIINFLGDATQGITSSAAGDTVTYTNADATTAQKGVSELATDAETIAGADTTRTIVPSALTAKLGTQTANALAYGAGSSSALSWTSALTDGQIVIGSTGNPPAAANITSSDSSITVTNGSNTIDLVTGAAVATSYTTDSGSAVPALGVLTVTGGVGCTTSGSGSTITIDVSSGGMDWTEVTVTGPTAMSVNSGYIANNAGVVGLTLPSTAALGDKIKIDGKGAGGWSIGQNAGQTIHFGNSDTTTGATGSLASTGQYDCVTLRCITANTDFVVEAAVGNLTVT